MNEKNPVQIPNLELDYESIQVVKLIIFNLYFVVYWLVKIVQPNLPD